MFGINGGELLVLILIAIIVIGPERMPEYAQQLRDWIVRGRDMVNDSKDQIKSEVGDEVDWKQYDPRQYDPRRIVREALADPRPSTAPAAAPRGTAASAAVAGTGVGAAATAAAPETRGADARAPFDDEAT